MRHIAKLRLLILLLVVCGCSRKEKVVLLKVAEGFNRPTYLTQPPDDPSRLFVVEQTGTIRMIRDGKVLPKPFLDLTDNVWNEGEMGLLSLAFHPHYAQNGYFYVDLINKERVSLLIRYNVSKNPDAADPESGKIIFKIKKPYRNHNGGQLQFGPDGMLDLSLGDGGRSSDPNGNGQSRADLFGDILRVDVDHGDPYSLPQDNPYLNQNDKRWEIWTYGLRNPWRFSFDHDNGDIYIGDVGEKGFEEIDVLPAGKSDWNFGWSIMEGAHCFHTPNCDTKNLAFPAAEYSHQEGCAVIGGYVYRGKEISSIRGHYFYADYCLGWIHSFKYEGGKATEKKDWGNLDVPGNILSFGEDRAQNLYVLFESGKIYRFALGKSG